MEGAAWAHGKADSDYGSELNSDEDVSLTELLQQAPLSPLLVLKDIEDHEGPRTARVPRVFGRDRCRHVERSVKRLEKSARRAERSPRRVHSSKGGTEKRSSVESEGYCSISAPGRLKGLLCGYTD